MAILAMPGHGQDARSTSAADQPSALAYHDLTPGGLPVSTF
jgi:hypothetical protein